MSFQDVPAGKIAAVVTHLQMFERPASRQEQPNSALTLTHVVTPDLAWYRTLFRRVGENWIWFSRLRMPGTELAAIIHDPKIEVHVLKSGGNEAGLLELDFRNDRECELGFFGLTQEFVGGGAGRWLMNRAIERAWSQPISRFWVHTCTFDHQNAVAFYVRSGFRPFRQQIEFTNDPRLTGDMPRHVAPHVPIIE